MFLLFDNTIRNINELEKHKKTYENSLSEINQLIEQISKEIKDEETVKNKLDSGPRFYGRNQQLNNCKIKLSNLKESLDECKLIQKEIIDNIKKISNKIDFMENVISKPTQHYSLLSSPGIFG